MDPVSAEQFGKVCAKDQRQYEMDVCYSGRNKHSFTEVPERSNDKKEFTMPLPITMTIKNVSLVMWYTVCVQMILLTGNWLGHLLKI